MRILSATSGSIAAVNPSLVRELQAPECHGSSHRGPGPVSEAPGSGRAVTPRGKCGQPEKLRTWAGPGKHRTRSPKAFMLSMCCRARRSHAGRANNGQPHERSINNQRLGRLGGNRLWHAMAPRDTRLAVLEVPRSVGSLGRRPTNPHLGFGLGGAHCRNRAPPWPSCSNSDAWWTSASETRRRIAGCASAGSCLEIQSTGHLVGRTHLHVGRGNQDASCSLRLPVSERCRFELRPSFPRC